MHFKVLFHISTGRTIHDCDIQAFGGHPSAYCYTIFWIGTLQVMAVHVKESVLVVAVPLAGAALVEAVHLVEAVLGGAVHLVEAALA